MNPGHTRGYTPVLRGPLLFHQNSLPSSPTTHPTRPTQQVSGPQPTNLFLPHPSPYTLQSRFTHPSSLPVYPQYLPYYPAVPSRSASSMIPFSSYTISPLSCAPTVSSRGLSLILIATLILVALDLVIVRPQRR